MIISGLVVIYLYIYISGPIYCDSDDGSSSLGDDDNISVGNTDSDNRNNSIVESTNEVNTESNISSQTGPDEEKNKIYVKSTDTDFVLTVNKEALSTGINTIAKAIESVGGQIVNNVAAGAAGGAVGAAVIKATSSIPPLQRIAAVGASVLVASTSATVGIGVGKAIIKNSVSGIKTSPHSDSNVDRIPSPEEYPNNSVLESTESIDGSLLYTLIRSDFILTLLIFALILIFLVLIFNKYVLKHNVDILSKFFSKRSKRISEWLINKDIKNKNNFYNNKLFFILFIFNTIFLVYILLLKLYIGSLLVLNLNEYVEEHHNISKSILLLIGSVYLPVAKVKGTNPFSTSPLLQLNRPLDPARLIECGEEEDQNKYLS